MGASYPPATCQPPPTTSGEAPGSRTGYLAGPWCAPFMYPPTLLGFKTRLGGFWCAGIFPQNPICMGNFKNRLTSTKPHSGFARIWGLRQIFLVFGKINLRCTDTRERGEPNGTALAVVAVVLVGPGASEVGGRATLYLPCRWPVTASPG